MRKIIAIVVVLSLCLSSGLAFANGNSGGKTRIFIDLGSDHWSYEAVKTMVEYDILSGYQDGSFKPDAMVSRAEFAKIMVMALALPLDKSSKSQFIDVKDNYWANIYLNTAKNYLTGYSTTQGTMFKPNQAALREDMAVALVKALDYTLVDDAILDDYSDEASISKNLRPYVATAVKKGLIKGYSYNGKMYLDPQGELTRAQASQLLLNVIMEEKIVLTDDDDEKIVLDDDAVEPQDIDLAINSDDDGLTLDWSKVDKTGFKYYKVVASLSDSTPKFPDNGYATYIKDVSDTEYEVSCGDKYYRGDFSKFKSGQTYYFAVTAVYENGNKYTSNVVKKTLKCDDEDYADEAIKLTVKELDGGLQLNWTQSQRVDFKGYKVVISKSDDDPTYPSNGYYKYITDIKDNSIVIPKDASYKDGDFKTLEEGKYYVRIVVLYDDEKAHSNVVYSEVE